MVIAVEPMLTLGDPDTDLDEDGWTVRSADGTRAAHSEHNGRAHGVGALGAHGRGRWPRRAVAARRHPQSGRGVATGPAGGARGLA